MKKDAQIRLPGREQEDRLDGWKEIAGFLGKDVRTAIRWSKDGGMPVYRHAEGQRGAIYAYRSEIDEWIRSDRSDSFQFNGTRPYRKTVLVWIGAVSALILVSAASFLWNNSSTDQGISSVEERPRVLIADFDNRSREAQFEGILEAAVRAELADSRRALVVAPKRVRDMLALMKRAPDVTIDADLGREICLRDGGIRALLTGRVEKFGSNYLLRLEVVDPSDGRAMAVVEEAAGEDEVLPAVHRLGDWLRENLGEELAQIRLTDVHLEKVATTSLRALEHYSEGTRLLQQGEERAAEIHFRHALEEDPVFASAHLYLFLVLRYLGKGSEEEAQASLEIAMKLADSASDQERHFIEGAYYEYKEKNYEEACRSYKIVAELFPDHYWAAGRVAYVCGWRLGHREDYVRAVVQAEQLSSEYTMPAAKALCFLEGDFDRGRPYVDRMRNLIADGEISASWGGAHVFTELFAAEEYLAQGLVEEVVSELQRVELARDKTGSYGPREPGSLVFFYLALGQFQKARALAPETGGPRQYRTWCAFLAGDQAAFREHLEDFLRDQLRVEPDPTKRLVKNLGLGMGVRSLHIGGHDAGMLAPLYDPESALETALASVGPELAFSVPATEAKLQLLRGKQMIAQGHPDEGIELLERGVEWFRDRGLWPTFKYYLLGAEILAVAEHERGNLQIAYNVLLEAASQRKMVNSVTAPLYQRIQARQALYARELENRNAVAEEIEAELKEALRYADPDHPILRQIREQRDVLMKIE